MPPRSLKKINTSEVRLGMFIEGFCGSWMDHPFWRNRFLLSDERELRLIRECAIKEVLIDVACGKDVEHPIAQATEAPSADLLKDLQEALQAPPERDTAEVSMQQEWQRAADICNAANDAVKSMFSELRMGRAINQTVARQVSQEIADSVMRNGGALISLARLKTADGYTYMHSVAVCALMVALARRLGLDDEQTRAAGFGGLMHDLGKVDIPLQVLNKPGRLTEAEFDQVRQHPANGHRRLLEAGVSDLTTLDICLHHHERLDGNGYPEHLHDAHISRMARMGAVCDIYDAITSNRPYKNGWDPAESLAKMAHWCDHHLDRQIFQAFVKSLGIYPTGSLVSLSDGKLAVVVEQSKASLLKPIVKTVFSTRSQERVLPQLIDLSAPACRHRIAKREDPRHWKIANLDELWMEELAKPRSLD